MTHREANARFKRLRRIWSRIKQNKHERDEAYLAWMRSLPCRLCWPTWWESGMIWEILAAQVDPASCEALIAELRAKYEEAERAVIKGGSDA